MSKMDKEYPLIIDGLGILWRYNPRVGRVVCVEDKTRGGGYYVDSFGDAWKLIKKDYGLNWQAVPGDTPAESAFLQPAAETKKKGNTMTVIEIVRIYLKANGFDGLAGDGCACGIDDLVPCDNDPSVCEPAKKRLCIKNSCSNMNCNRDEVQEGDDCYYVPPAAGN